MATRRYSAFGRRISAPPSERAAVRSAMSSSSTTTTKKKRYDPVLRYRGLESELFKLKFERAKLMEEAQVRELTDRRNREEMERLRERLSALGKCLDGIAAQKAKKKMGSVETDDEEEGTAMTDAETVADETAAAGGGSDESEPQPQAQQPTLGLVELRNAWESLMGYDAAVNDKDGDGGSKPDENSDDNGDEEGLRRRRIRLKDANEMLKRDVARVRLDLESERARESDISSALERSESDHYRADSEQKSLKSQGERLAADVERLRAECTSKSVELANARDRRDSVAEEARALRERLGFAQGEVTELKMRYRKAGEETRQCRWDARMSRVHSERVRDDILARRDPVEWRRQRPRRRERRRTEKAVLAKAAAGA